MLDTLYAFAKFQYECGNYSGAADYLYLHRGLVPVSDKVRLYFFTLMYCGKISFSYLRLHWLID